MNPIWFYNSIYHVCNNRNMTFHGDVIFIVIFYLLPMNSDIVFKTEYNAKS